MKIKKLLKREWDWYRGSQSQKDLYIKTLTKIIIEQDRRIAELENELTH